MKIKMLTLYAGPKGVMENGHEYDVDPALAKDLVAGRFASPVRTVASDVPVIETTAAPAEQVEKAVIEQPSEPVAIKSKVKK